MKMVLETEFQGIFRGNDIKKSKKSPKKEKKNKKNPKLIANNDEPSFQFLSKPFSSWNQEDILHWLDSIGFREECEEVFRNYKITGPSIKRLTESGALEDLVGIKKETLSKIASVVRLICIVGSSKPFLNLASKLIKFHDFTISEFGDVSSSKFEEIVSIFCDPSMMKHRYLSTCKRKDFSKFPRIKQKRKNEEVEGEEEEDNQEDPRSKIRYSCFQRTKVRIKIIITEMQFTNPESCSISELLSPVFQSNIFPTTTRGLGPLYTAVEIGPWYFEWTKSGIVVPKLLSSKNMIFSDVDTIYVQKKGMMEITDKLSEAVVLWNTSHFYKESSFDKKTNEKNCQDFVDYILEVVGVPIVPSTLINEKSSLYRFLELQRKFGHSKKMVFRMKKKFIEYFSNEKKRDGLTKEIEEYLKREDRTIVFESHLQLDEFCRFMSRNCFEIHDLFWEDWILLKSWDRVFWFRHLLDLDDEKFKPLDPRKFDLSEFPTGCPFKDPREVYISYF